MFARLAYVICIYVQKEIKMERVRKRQSKCVREKERNKKIKLEQGTYQLCLLDWHMLYIYIQKDIKKDRDGEREIII